MGLYLALWTIWFQITAGGDPALGPSKSRSEARNMECERIPVALAVARYPGVVRPPDPRGDLVEREVLVCTEKLMAEDLRSPSDEAILSNLDETAQEIAGLATASRPELKSATWLVESHTANPEVSAKLSFAAKNALVAQGLRVSDRTPILGFDDINVITRLPPMEAWPAACRRYRDTGGMGENDALLATVVLNPKETILHTGVCAQGAWTWLR